jgi:hypothetical protein
MTEDRYDRVFIRIETNAPHDQERLHRRSEAMRPLEPVGPPAPKPGGHRRFTT